MNPIFRRAVAALGMLALATGVAAAQGKPKVSKADLQAYINEHKISLDEVDRGTQRQQLQAQRDKVYAEQNKLWEQLRYPREDGGITIGQWLRSADEAP